MKGLIKKDILLIKNNLKQLVILVILFTTFLKKDYVNFYFIPILLSVILFISSFNYDEINNWDYYVLSLPSGRENVVKGKYIASLFMIGWATLLTYIASLIIGIISKSMDFKVVSDAIMGGFMGALLLESFILPFIFKFGFAKGKMVLVVVGVILSLFLGIFVHFKLSLIETFLDKYGTILIILIFLGSYFLSKFLYLKRKF